MIQQVPDELIDAYAICVLFIRCAETFPPAGAAATATTVIAGSAAIRSFTTVEVYTEFASAANARPCTARFRRSDCVDRSCEPFL